MRSRSSSAQHSSSGPIQLQSPARSQSLWCIPRTRGIGDTYLPSNTNSARQGNWPRMPSHAPDGLQGRSLRSLKLSSKKRLCSACSPCGWRGQRMLFCVCSICCAIKTKQPHKKSFFCLTTVTQTHILHSPLSLSSELSVPVTLKPLSQFAEAWRMLPGISRWVLNTIISGYTLQFACRPPRFNSVVTSEVQAANTPVLRAEIHNLFAKGAMEIVPPEERETGFYSRYFQFQKGRWPSPCPRSALFESRSSKTLIQNDYTETNPIAHSAPGLVYFSGHKGCLFPYPVSPSSQTFSEICFRTSVLSIFGTPLRPLLCSTHFYKVHERSPLPSSIDGNTSSELPR